VRHPTPKADTANTKSSAHSSRPYTDRSRVTAPMRALRHARASVAAASGRRVRSRRRNRRVGRASEGSGPMSGSTTTRGLEREPTGWRMKPSAAQLSRRMPMNRRLDPHWPAAARVLEYVDREDALDQRWTREPSRPHSLGPGGYAGAGDRDRGMPEPLALGHGLEPFARGEVRLRIGRSLTGSPSTRASGGSDSRHESGCARRAPSPAGAMRSRALTQGPSTPW
jgi:hypothetical protein